MSDYSDDEDPKVIFSKMLVWGFIFFGVLLGVITIIYLISPWWRSLDAKATEHGYVAVSSKKELLLKLNQDWMKLDSQRIEASRSDPELAKTYAAQQAAIVDRIKIEAKTLPPEEVPPEVKGFLR